MPGGAIRDLKKEKYWRRIVRGHIDSGLSIRAWCKKHGENDAAFHWWRRELARRDAERPKAAFVPVHVTEDASANTGGGIEILLGGGQRVRVSGRVDRQMLADVLAVVSSASAVEPESQAC
jgi:hypothetical protein